MQRKLNWCYAGLLVCLICLGWQFVRSGSQLVSVDGASTVCYSCDGWSDEKVFEFGGFVFVALLLLRILRRTKRASQVELIVALLCWLYVGSQVLAMDVSSIILTIRLGNWILLAWMACYVSLAPVVAALRYAPNGGLCEP